MTQGIVVVIFLVIVVEIDEVGIVIVAPLPLGAVTGEMPLLSALEACIISRVARWPLGVGNVPSCGTSSPSTPPIIRGTGSVNVH